MKYYSDILNKLFDTPEALNQEEKAYKKQQQEAERKQKILQEKQAKEAAELEISKKQYAAAVELADQQVSEAYKNLEIAKQDAKALSEEFMKKLSEIMEPAKQAVKEAETVRLQAIREFTSKFGVYKANYNGERAAEEYMRARSRFDDFFTLFDRFL